MLGIFPRVLTIPEFESIAAISAVEWDFHIPNAITILPYKNIKPFCHYCFFCKQQTIPAGTQGTAGAKRRGKDMRHKTFPLWRVRGCPMGWQYQPSEPLMPGPRTKVQGQKLSSNPNPSNHLVLPSHLCPAC